MYDMSFTKIWKFSYLKDSYTSVEGIERQGGQKYTEDS